MTDLTAPITITVEARQLKRLAGLARQARRKAQQQLAKSTFVPEPGKRHAGEIAVSELTRLEHQLRDALPPELRERVGVPRDPAIDGLA